MYNLSLLILVTGILDISSTGDGSTVCELTLSGIESLSKQLLESTFNLFILNLNFVFIIIINTKLLNLSYLYVPEG